MYLIFFAMKKFKIQNVTDVIERNNVVNLKSYFFENPFLKISLNYITLRILRYYWYFFFYILLQFGVRDC